MILRYTINYANVNVLTILHVEIQPCNDKVPCAHVPFQLHSSR